jgi:hypothetical protein
MFLGHIAVEFAAKRVAPKTSLGVLLGASELIDLLFPVFCADWLGTGPNRTGQQPLSRSRFLLPSVAQPGHDACLGPGGGVSFLPLFFWAHWFDRHREPVTQPLRATL